MTTQPKTIDSPMLGTTWVSVSRGVLAELLSSELADMSERGRGTLDDYKRIERLRDSVEQGRIDVLDAATFNGTQDPA